MEIEEQTSSGEAMPERFTLHYDFSNEWLEVPISILSSLKLERQISNASFQKEGKVYLEEQLDAILFERAYLKKIGRPGDHQYFAKLLSFEYHGHLSIIRGYPKYNHSVRRHSPIEK